VLPASCWFLAWFIFRLWRCRRHVPPKRWLIFQWTTWRYVLEGRTLHNHRCHNLKSYIRESDICLQALRQFLLAILARSLAQIGMFHFK
jgi:hypothetical protein